MHCDCQLLRARWAEECSFSKPPTEKYLSEEAQTQYSLEGSGWGKKSNYECDARRNALSAFFLHFIAGGRKEGVAIDRKS